MSAGRQTRQNATNAEFFLAAEIVVQHTGRTRGYDCSRTHAATAAEPAERYLMEDDQGTRLIELDSFDTASAVEPGKDAQTKRRFMTLLVDATVSGDPTRARIRKAHNTAGETFAVKSLFPLVGPAAGVPEGLSDTTFQALASAFFEGYRNLLTVSRLKGFPKVYGYGLVGRVPIMVMEWVEGPNLLEARPLLPHVAHSGEEPTGVEADAVAAIGEAAASVLVQTSYLDSTFAHRDISPRNIVLETSSRSVAEQVASGSYDVRLVDLESSSIVRQEPSTFTMRNDIWRHGTPEYAAPEMLTRDVPGIEALRHSPSVDVYALCSVLYELYSGRTPYDVASKPLQSPYQIKMADGPADIVPRDERDTELVATILAGIAPDPAERIEMHELLGRLRAWRAHESYRPVADRPDERAATPVAGTHLSMKAPVEGGSERGDAGIGAGNKGRDSDAARPSGSNAADRGPASLVADAKKPALRLTRRAAIGLGIGGLVVLGAAAAVATRGFGLLRPRTMDDYGWDELAELADRIAAAASDDEALGIARKAGLVNADGSLTDEHVKRFPLADGTAAEAQIVGFRTDRRADGQGVAGISLLMRTPVGDPRPMNDGLRLGGWEQSSLREWMATEMLGLLPAELVSRVRPVVKDTNNVGAVDTGESTELSQTTDAFWLPSMTELCGYQGPETFGKGYEYLSDLYSYEGAQYQLFNELGISGLSANEAIVRRVAGERVYWWERTPSADASVGMPSTVFNRVMRDGDAFNGATPGDAPAEPTYVIPGFCL